MRTAHLWIPLLVLCFATEASAQKTPDVILLDTGCLSMGSVLGKNDTPMVSKTTTTSIFICNKTKGGLACQMSSLKGGKYVGAGKSKAVAFTFLSDTGDRFQLMMEGSLVTLYVDRNAQAYVLAQQYWEESTGLMIQKQCVGVYAAGGRVAELLKRIEN